MSLTAKTYCIVIVVLSSFLGLESTFAQVGTDTIPETKRVRDTIVIVKRDTVVILQKEKIRVIQEPSNQSDSEDRQLSRGRGGSTNEDIIEQRRRMREERAREYEEWWAAQPLVRHGNTWGYKYYLTALGQVDFPSLKVGIERTFNGQIGIQGNLGILIPPADLWSVGFNRDIGKARYGIRGLDFGLNARYYLSDQKKRFPFYLEVESSFSISPIEIGLWTTSADGTFEEFVQAPANAKQFYFGFITGWELRTDEGLLLDLATGIRVGTKSIQSSNAQVQQLITNRYWNLNEQGLTGHLTIVTRIGIGYGKWSTPEKKTSSRKSKKHKKRR